ncbi:MAG: tetratricopeptide repeat protein [Hyphomicrobiaceae bacterium]|nr:tetratricopeptide repeat protein [Hyphomicrobiaceae bacterium]
MQNRTSVTRVTRHALAGRFSAVVAPVLAALIPLASAAVAQAEQPSAGLVRACEDGDPDEVIASCTVLMQAGSITSGRFSMLLNNRGIGFAKKGYIDLAIGDFLLSTHLDQKNALPLNNLCRVWLDKHQGDRAIDACSRSIAIAPERYESYANRSLGHLLSGNYPAALADADRALEINPRCAQTHANRGVLLERLGRIGPAIEDFERALEIDPDFAWAKENLLRLKSLRPEASGAATRVQPGSGDASPEAKRQIPHLRACA